MDFDFNAIKLKIASPDEILSWSHGEVIKPETINYRTQRPEKDGLFSERIFGPTKDYECYCGKYRRIRYKGIVCDRCGVEVTHSSVRRERMGHISLATPVSHIWFLKVITSKIGLFIDVPVQKLEKVIYYAAFIITGVNEESRRRVLKELEEELDSRKKEVKGDKIKIKELQEKAQETKAQLMSFEVGRILTEAEYFSLSRRFGDVFEAGSGAEAVRRILENIDLKKLLAKVEKDVEGTREENRKKKLLFRLKMVHSFIRNKMRPEWMVMTVLPVLPPELRPMVALDGGRYATSDLNDLYRRVINRNNRLKKLMELKAPEVIVVNEKRMLQEAVDALIDNSIRFGGTAGFSKQKRPLRSLADILKGKKGRFRQNLLGKRVDYSGRSVIVVGPELNFYNCGLPKKMALELFKPFVISKVISYGLAHTVRNATRLIETAPAEVWGILEEVIAGKKVLLNRAPTLHRLGIQAFEPVLIEDLAIRIPPMVCTAFNADFDGDQMAVHLPLSDEAQEESGQLMLSTKNILKPASGDPIAFPSQDIVLGCYYLTKLDENGEGKGSAFSSKEEAMLAFDFNKISINAPIKVMTAPQTMLETSVGRLIFNGVLPEELGYINDVMTKKNLQKVVAEIIDKLGMDQTWRILDRIKNLGFSYASVSGISWAMDDLVIPAEKKEFIAAAEKEVRKIEEQYEEGLLTDSERRARVVGVWEEVKDKIAKVVPETLRAYKKFNSVFSIIDSGARGSWTQPVQMTGMKGLVQNPRGETIEIPIKASYKEGLTPLEFFINTHSSRKGLADTALKTATAGYLTRRLVDVSQDVIIREKDCKTTVGTEIFRRDGAEFGYNFGQRIFGRTVLENVKVGGKVLVEAGQIVSRKAAKLINDEPKVESVKVRSPLYCKTLYGVCSSCYGMDLGSGKEINLGEAVGVIAAQSIGEPGTQLTMRTFHTGGVAGMDITHGLPRVDEVFEARSPKGKAVLAEDDGSISDIEFEDSLKVIKLKTSKNKKTKIIEYSVPRTTEVFVSAGDKVSRGDQLCEGSVDLKELFEYKGREAVERYMINEIQKIYIPEGNVIDDKHIEIIIRQMFARVMIKDSGDTDLVAGETIEKSKFLELNREMKRRGKQPARSKQLLLGISRVALSTESFLSAASFQETAKVLVNAAVEGKEDRLRGLKENVIIGRLIPAGTGFRKKKEEPEEK